MLMTENIYMNGLIGITDKEFKLISDIVYKKFGINLTEKKKSLVVGRLNKLIKSLGLKSFNDYYNKILDDTSNISLLSLIDAISTNHTFFYRENDHFQYLLNRALPGITKELIEKGDRDLRVWCAGCATGEEAYTLAIILNEFFGYQINQWDVGILATDISVTSLEKAQKGIYSEDKISNLPISYKNKYFKKNEDKTYEVKSILKDIILFKRLNFMNDNFPFKGKFHIIFCRNVMIYFDKDTKDKFVNRLYRYMYNGAYIFIGHSESLDRKNCLLEYIQPAIYKRC
jgi:chemotaxis protein methyltransferase CheR